jgi:hypothetical protein
MANFSFALNLQLGDIDKRGTDIFQNRLEMLFLNCKNVENSFHLQAKRTDYYVNQIFTTFKKHGLLLQYSHCICTDRVRVISFLLKSVLVLDVHIFF